jgi:hypothetical protein
MTRRGVMTFVVAFWFFISFTCPSGMAGVADADSASKKDTDGSLAEIGFGLPANPDPETDPDKSLAEIAGSVDLVRDVPWDPASLEADPDGTRSGKIQVIYGTDDRKDWYQETNATVRGWSDSVCALLLADDVWYNGDGTYDIFAYQWLECDWWTDPNCDNPLPPCPAEPFGDQPVVSFCTGFLVGPDLVATAGHCCQDESWLLGTRFVFGFKMLDAATPVMTLDASQVYTGIELVGQAGTSAVDYAIIRLDRPVTAPGAVPLPIRRSGTVPVGTSIGIIGHPSGLPLKIAFGSGTEVISNASIYYFEANLDSFVGNSGSPVFHAGTGEVEGILVGGLEDFVFSPTCFSSNRLSDYQGQEQVTRSTVFDHLVPQCGIAVAEPNGGESWLVGSTHIIRWVSSGNPGTLVRIDLYRGAALVGTPVVSTPDDGEFPWTVPADLEPGSDYRIRVGSRADPSCEGFSKTPFSIAEPPVPLAEALDTTSLVWASSGNAEWVGQTATSFYGGDSAESGNISDNEMSVLETSVTGPAQLRFHWRVSSESIFDELEFSIDGFYQDAISGETNWQEESYSLQPGNHSLRWSYVKDYSLSEGQDRGWVDYVRIVWPTPTVTPTGTPTPTAPPTATPTPVPGDVTGDGIVDGTDLFFFSQWWNSGTTQANSHCDVVEDGVIDEHDLLGLVPLWKE